VVEGRVDDAVGRLCGDAQTVQVVHVAAEDLCPGTGECLGPRVRPAEPDHAMACADKFRNQKGTDKAGGACQKHSHPTAPVFVCVPAYLLRSVLVKPAM
jgi:hypothetical protein